MPLPRPVRLSLTGALLSVALLGCAAGTEGTTAPVRAETAAFHGTEPPVDPGRPSFVLRDTAGNRFDFRAETAGRPTLLYFGFTNCADECPTAMAGIAGALRTSSPDVRGKTRVVFVTTDPARDTPPAVRRWLDQWSADYVGLVGTQAEVDAAQEAVGLQPAVKGADAQTLPGRPDAHEHAEGTTPHEHFGPLGYGVGHADVIFAFDTRDRLPVFYPGSVRPSDLAADLTLLAPGDAS